MWTDHISVPTGPGTEPAQDPGQVAGVRPLHDWKYRPRRPGVPAGRPTERGDAETDPAVDDPHLERLFATYGMSGQGAIAESGLIRLVHRPHDPAACAERQRRHAEPRGGAHADGGTR